MTCTRIWVKTVLQSSCTPPFLSEIFRRIETQESFYCYFIQKTFYLFLLAIFQQSFAGNFDITLLLTLVTLILCLILNSSQLKICYIIQFPFNATKYILCHCKHSVDTSLIYIQKYEGNSTKPNRVTQEMQRQKIIQLITIARKLIRPSNWN